MARTHNLMSFVRDLRERRVGWVSPVKLAVELGLSVEGLARCAGIGPGIISDDDTAAVQRRLQEIVAIIEASTAFTDSIPSSIEWYFQDPLFERDARTAQEFVAGGDARLVASYLKDLAFHYGVPFAPAFARAPGSVAAELELGV
jgi:hypothetical protein